MAKWKRGLRVASILSAAVVAGASISGVHYAISNFSVEIDGESAGYLSSFTPPSYEVEEITQADGKKQLTGTVTTRDGAFALAPPLAAGMQGWVNGALQGARSAHEATVLTSVEGKPFSMDEFDDALITELGFPACDGDSKDVASLTVRFRARATQHKPAGERAKDIPVPKRKPWTASAFRVSLAGLPTKNVLRLEPFVVRIPPKGPPTPNDGPNGDPPPSSPVEVGNLTWTIAGPDTEAWAAWFDDFAVRGNNGDNLEKNGSIQVLDDAGAVMLTVTLSHVGIFSLTRLPPLRGKAGESLEALQVGLYVESLGLE